MPDYSAKGARVWAQDALSSASWGEREAAKALLDLLPSPTLGETGWDYDVHHMEGATTPHGEEVVMLWYDNDTNLVMCFEGAWRPDELTPTGTMYEVVVDTGIPETLFLKRQFEQAPSGTIVAKPGFAGWTRTAPGEWSGIPGTELDEDMAASGPWEVLRWGRGENEERNNG